MISRFLCACIHPTIFTQQEKAAYTGGRRVDRRNGIDRARHGVGRVRPIDTVKINIPSDINMQTGERERERAPTTTRSTFLFPPSSVRAIVSSKWTLRFIDLTIMRIDFIHPLRVSPRISSKRYVGREIVLTLYPVFVLNNSSLIMISKWIIVCT